MVYSRPMRSVKLTPSMKNLIAPSAVPELAEQITTSASTLVITRWETWRRKEEQRETLMSDF